jgi:hypothetical protein
MVTVVEHNAKFRVTELLIQSAAASVSAPIRRRGDFSHSPDDVSRILVNAAIRNNIFYPIFVSLKGRDYHTANDASSQDPYRSLYYQYVVANSVWVATSCRVLRLFAEKGIEAMPMSGLHLSHSYYASTLMRFALDADFFMRSRNDKSKAEELLIRDGFNVDYSSPLETNLTKRYSRFSAHCELHLSPRSVMYSFEYPKWPDVWSNSGRVSLGGLVVPVMRPEHVLLACCANMSWKGMFSARDFLDLRQVIRLSRPFDWSIIMDVGKAMIWRYVMLIPLHLLHFLGTRFLGESLVPEEVLARLGRGTNLPLESGDKLDRLVSTVGLPINYRDILTCIDYARTPFFTNYFLWTKGQHPTLRRRALRVFLEAGNIFTFVRGDYGDNYAITCLRSWGSACLSRFAANRVSAGQPSMGTDCRRYGS